MNNPKAYIECINWERDEWKSWMIHPDEDFRCTEEYGSFNDVYIPMQQDLIRTYERCGIRTKIQIVDSKSRKKS